MTMIIKILLTLAVGIVVVYGLLWLLSFRTFDVSYGVSFNQNHATSLGLDWKVAYEDMLKELQPTYVRIAALWSAVEPQPGIYRYEDVDWMMDMAQTYGAKVTLVIGQKAPRWPECYVPNWADQSSERELIEYIQRTTERYKDHAALDMWQVENEPFIQFRFGDCEKYNPDAIVAEIETVRSLDKDHQIVVTDSGELGFWYSAGKAGDVFGTTVYRVVRNPGGSVFTYDWLPAAVYRVKAKLFSIDVDSMIISELQAEPWFTESNPLNTSIEEQEQTMNPDRMKKNIEYVRHIGSRRAYFWGVEWWYFMKQEHQDGRYWEIAKETLAG
ncbi:MAG: hypothetical protein COU35_01345 [Candidatus Magasanikbacteria bacterium CG10_big_fil_rev_8_21_14_0_10_47_10]|uniref:GH10 domain-containing protein n=1 Tax=Candidatus Magasanikbacteria bacterium CG10_big_fil_rev_8_21_14_0_10_47_10 TaxID=1974652 RepID=A0A2H0TR51_9BACT|nr:MAG: hypothetical protein COU35_01345 [Candidatus Magasanikbacteria bacterium CG10_big_fil_rev_8_21_14_0_10_47_10]